INLSPIVAPSTEAPVGTKVTQDLFGRVTGTLFVPPVCALTQSCAAPGTNADFRRLLIDAALQGTITLTSLLRPNEVNTYWAETGTVSLTVLPTAEPGTGILLATAAAIGLRGTWRPTHVTH